jgi:glycosyltransferase involved in cell wall biosynthesis
MEAMALVERELPRNLLLVLSGRPFPADHPAALAIKDLGIGHRVIHVGYRSPLEARALFQSCEALVFPSLFEGFGMPVAEAMIAGKPVACSNCTALPEVTGGAALTFDPEDVADIANCLLRISTQVELRASLTTAAIRRRAAFSGRRSAVQTLAIYQRLFELAEA